MKQNTIFTFDQKLKAFDIAVKILGDSPLSELNENMKPSDIMFEPLQVYANLAEAVLLFVNDIKDTPPQRSSQ